MARLTISGSGYEIYGAEADYDAYLLVLPRARERWECLTVSERRRAMVAAARLIDRQRFRGDPTDPVQVTFALTQPADTQGLQWPRTGVTDRNGEAIANDTIPNDVLAAAYELAHELTVDATTVETADAESRIKIRDETIGPIRERVEYFESQAGEGGRFPQIVQELLGPYLEAGATIVAGNFGTDQESRFFDDQFGFSNLGLR